jgi:hypothetical protein
MKIFSLLSLFFVLNLNIEYALSQKSSSSQPVGLVLYSRNSPHLGDTDASSLAFNLILYGGDRYKMFVGFAFSIPSDSILISCGKFKRDNKFLYLTDERIGCNQVFKVEKSGHIWYYPYVAFSGFQNTLGFFEYNFSANDEGYQKKGYWTRWNCQSLESEKGVKYSTLLYGKYGGKYSSIELIPPNKYTYMLRNHVFSKGTFKRIGRTDKLQLMDEKLMQPVYFFIRDKMLIDNFIVLDPSCPPTELRYAK